MKKIIFNLLALFAISISTVAQTVSVENVSAVPGETVSFSVSLSGGKADKYTAMTLYAQFPTSGFATTGDYEISSSWAGTMGVVGDINSEGLATIPFASANAITGTDVDNLVTIYFTVASDITPGDYTVTLKKTMFEYGLSSKDYADDATFTVTVSNTVILDETSTTAPTAKEGVNALVKRTIKADEWSTICLPFAMTADQLSSAFGNDVAVKNFTGCTVNGNNITANFETVTAIEANHPYIIKVSNDITEFTVDNVDIAPAEDLAVNCDKKGKNYNSFIGTYVNGTVIPDYSLFLYDNKFYFSKGKTKIKAYRGYFSFDVAVADYEPESNSRLFMHFDDDATSINSVKEDAEEYVYDLQGRRVDNSKLAKGIYIVNGKKTLMK